MSVYRYKCVVARRAPKTRTQVDIMTIHSQQIRQQSQSTSPFHTWATAFVTKGRAIDVFICGVWGHRQPRSISVAVNKRMKEATLRKGHQNCSKYDQRRRIEAAGPKGSPKEMNAMGRAVTTILNCMVSDQAKAPDSPVMHGPARRSCLPEHTHRHM